MKKELQKLFPGLPIYDEGEYVVNPFTLEGIELNAEELSLYDFIIGAQHTIDRNGGVFNPSTFGLQKEMSKALSWFRNNNAKAYMVLLD
jgi:hypothetical protein